MLFNNYLRCESQVVVCTCIYICIPDKNRTLINLTRKKNTCNLNYCLPFTNGPKIESKPICWVSLMCFFEEAKDQPAFRHTCR